MRYNIEVVPIYAAIMMMLKTAVDDEFLMMFGLFVLSYNNRGTGTDVLRRVIFFSFDRKAF